MASVTTTTTTATAWSTPLIPGLVQRPEYQLFAPVWTKLAHAAEGVGGFGDGTYLVAHPREWKDHQADNPSKPTKKLLERRTLARYENWPDTILTLIAGGLFRKAPVRIVGEASDRAHPIEAWWQDVDGRGTTLDAWLAHAWRVAAVFGHAFCVMDRAQDAAPTMADAAGPFLRLYTPLDVPHWIDDERGALVAITLIEALPLTGFDATTPDLQARRLTVDGWEILPSQAATRNGAVPLTGSYDYAGVLPVVELFAKQRPLSPVLGMSVLGDPALYQDDYNLTSEIRELLRKQTFSILNVPLGLPAQNGVSVEDAKAMLGEVTGTSNVMFTPLEAQMLTADTNSVAVYQTEQDRLRRTMFRLAGLPWEGDSRDAESADSRRLKREDLNQTLAGYADLCEAADRQLAQLWFRQAYGDRWRQEWERAEITIDWPETFDSEVIDDLLARVAQAQTLGLGQTAVTLMRQQVAHALLPVVPSSVHDTIDAEIAALPSPEEAAQQARSDRLGRLLGAGEGEGPPEAPTPPGGAGEPEEPEDEDEAEDDGEDMAEDDGEMMTPAAPAATALDIAAALKDAIASLPAPAAPTITVEAPTITVEAPAPAPAPNVTIADGAVQVTIAEGAVQTTLADGAVQVQAPVTVEPVTVNVTPSPTRPTTRRVVRDAGGNIESIREE